MAQHHKYQISEIENLVIFERDIYVELLINFIKEQEERQRMGQQMAGKAQSGEEILAQLMREGGKGAGRAQEQIAAAIAAQQVEQDKLEAEQKALKDEVKAEKEESKKTRRSILTKKDVKEIFDDLYTKAENKRKSNEKKLLKDAFKEMYDNAEKEKQRTATSATSQSSGNGQVNENLANDYKREATETRFGVEASTGITRENNLLIREQIQLQTRSITILQEIASAVKNMGGRSNGPSPTQTPRANPGPTTPSSVSRTAIATGAVGAAAATVAMTHQPSTPAASGSSTSVPPPTPSGGGNSGGSRSTPAIQEAQNRGGDKKLKGDLKFDSKTLTFTTNKLKFEVQTLTIDAKSVKKSEIAQIQQSSAAAVSASTNSQGASQGGQGNGQGNGTGGAPSGSGSGANARLNNAPGTNIYGNTPSAGSAGPGLEALNSTAQRVGAPNRNLAANQQEAYTALRAEGLSDSAARIAVANLSGEALHKPDDTHADPSRSNPNQRAHGIASWDGPRSERIRKQFGKMPNEMTVAEQSKAFAWEMKTHYKKAWSDLNNEELPTQARLYSVVKGFEAPARPDIDTAKRLGHLSKLKVEDIVPGGTNADTRSNGAAPGSAVRLSGSSVAGSQAATTGVQSSNARWEAADRDDMAQGAQMTAAANANAITNPMAKMVAAKEAAEATDAKKPKPNTFIEGEAPQFDAMGSVTVPGTGRQEFVGGGRGDGAAEVAARKAAATPAPEKVVKPKPQTKTIEVDDPNWDRHAKSRAMFQAHQDAERRGEDTHAMFFAADKQRTLELGMKAPKIKKTITVAAEKVIPQPQRRPEGLGEVQGPPEENFQQKRDRETAEWASDPRRAGQQNAKDITATAESNAARDQGIRTADMLDNDRAQESGPKTAAERIALQSTAMNDARQQSGESLARIGAPIPNPENGVVDTGRAVTPRNLAAGIKGPEASQTQFQPGYEGDGGAVLQKALDAEKRQSSETTNPDDGGWMGKYFPYLFGKGTSGLSVGGR